MFDWGHHQEDSTHVSDSVITLGFSGGPKQLEASTFHGREPDEKAYTFGYERDLPIGPSSVTTGIGPQITTYGLSPVFNAVYGSHPAAFSIFLHLRPAGNIGAHMQMVLQH